MNVYLVYLTDYPLITITEAMGVFLDQRMALSIADGLNNTKPDTVTGIYAVMALKLITGKL